MGGRLPSRTRALDLDDVFGHVDELVDETLAVHFGQNTALIVISVTRFNKMVKLVKVSVFKKNLILILGLFNWKFEIGILQRFLRTGWHFQATLRYSKRFFGILGGIVIDVLIWDGIFQKLKFCFGD